MNHQVPNHQSFELPRNLFIAGMINYVLLGLPKYRQITLLSDPNAPATVCVDDKEVDMSLGRSPFRYTYV